MKAAAALVLLLINVRLSRSCHEAGRVWFCTNIPQAFRPGLSTLILVVKDVGEINSTVLRSDNLASVTSLMIDNAGVTGIAEGAFGSFVNLTRLSLTQNFLTEINPNWFGRPDLLSELELTENHIEVLRESKLKGFVNLKRLSLSKNGIRAIDPNSFSSNTFLAELDLSENRMTRLSLQVFRSLGSTRIRLDGNPWDCSCGAEDFVDFLKDLQSRSLLDRQMEVTCASPPSLRGQPAWNVSVCVTSPSPPGPPPSVTQTPHRKPTAILTTVPESTSAKVVTTPPSRPTSETKTSVRSKPSDAPVTMSSNTATPPARTTPETKTSVRPKPSDILTTVTTSTLSSGAFVAHVTSPPSVTETSVRPEPSDPPRTISAPTGMTETCATSRPSSDTNIVGTLVVVIVVLSLLLFVGFFLAVLRRRKRNSKTVTPGRPEESRPESKEDGRSSRAPSPGHSEKRENTQCDSETGWRTSFTGVRAKSANAVLFTSPFCAPVEDEVTLQTETEAQSEDAENRAGGKMKLGDESEVDGGVETDDADVIKHAEQAVAGGNLDGNSHRDSVNTNTVAYLSIGTNQNKPSPDDFNKHSTDGSGQRSKTGKVMGRISTWPPTAVQWQARCKAKEDEEESDVFAVWTPKFSSEVKTVLKTEEHPSGSDWAEKEDDIENNLMEDLRTAPNQDPLKMAAAPVKSGHSRSSKPNDDTTRLSEALTHTGTRPEEQLKKEEEMTLDPTAVRWTQTLNEGKPCPDQDLKSAANGAQKKSGNKAEQRGDSKRAATSRQRAEKGSTGPKAPSGGASPDDETLLSGNEYAFMDLLHEVVQNNGRWTRERWKQKEANKQRRHDRATEGV